MKLQDVGDCGGMGACAKSPRRLLQRVQDQATQLNMSPQTVPSSRLFLLVFLCFLSLSHSKEFESVIGTYRAFWHVVCVNFLTGVM